MPLFHFDVRYSDQPWSDDDQGLEFATVDRARAEARDLIAAIAKESLREHSKLSVRIRDGKPEPVLTLSLSLRIDEGT